MRAPSISIRRGAGVARRFGPWLIVSAVSTAAAGAFVRSGATDFERFLGPLPATVTVAAAGAIGLGALAFLETRGFWRHACGARVMRGLVVATTAAVPFAAVAIGADLAAGFPHDTNVVWPGAWLFYAAILPVAETIFHLLPLALTMAVSGSWLKGRAIDRRTFGLMLPTAAVEPAAQVALGSALPAFVVSHVFVFGLVQLTLLRRYGYLPMLWFRVCYYLLWHVLWGEARLQLLF